MVAAALRTGLVLTTALALLVVGGVAKQHTTQHHQRLRAKALNAGRADTTRARGPWLDSELWPEGVIPWAVSRDTTHNFLAFSADGTTLNKDGTDVQAVMHTATSDIEVRTQGCLKFDERTATGAGVVSVQTGDKMTDSATANSATRGNGKSATALILKVSQVQSPSTSVPSLPHTVLHELGHVAGFSHTFQRGDRDTFVKTWHALPDAVSGTFTNIAKDTVNCMATRHRECRAKVLNVWGQQQHMAQIKSYVTTCKRVAGDTGEPFITDLLRGYPVHPKVHGGQTYDRYLPGGGTPIDNARLQWCAIGACVFEGVQTGHNFEKYESSKGWKWISQYDYHSVMNYAEAETTQTSPDSYNACMSKLLYAGSSVSRDPTEFGKFKLLKTTNLQHVAAQQLTALDVEMYQTAYGCTKGLTVHWASLLEPLADNKLYLRSSLLPRAWSSIVGVAWNNLLSAYSKAELCTIAGPKACPKLVDANEADLRRLVRATYIRHAGWARRLPADATLASLALRINAQRGNALPSGSKHAFVTRTQYEEVLANRAPTYLSYACLARAFNDDVIDGSVNESAARDVTLVLMVVPDSTVIPSVCA